MTRETLIQSTVQHEGKWFFVSTINRESSAALSYGSRYAETIAWEWNPDTKVRGQLLGNDEDSENSIRTHQITCARLFSTGKFDIEEADE